MADDDIKVIGYAYQQSEAEQKQLGSQDKPSPNFAFPCGIELPSKPCSWWRCLFLPLKSLPIMQRFDAYLKANIDDYRTQKGLPVKPPIGTKYYLQKYYHYRQKFQAKATKRNKI